MYVHVYVECIIYNGVMFVNIAIIFKVTTKLLTIKHDDDSVRQRIRNMQSKHVKGRNELSKFTPLCDLYIYLTIYPSMHACIHPSMHLST